MQKALTSLYAITDFTLMMLTKIIHFRLSFSPSERRLSQKQALCPLNQGKSWFCFPVNHWFKKALNYRTYRLVDSSKVYNKSVFKYARIATRNNAQMKPPTFNSWISKSAIGLLRNFKLTFGKNRVHEGTIMWLYPFFMEKTAPLVLIALLSADFTDYKYGYPKSGRM